MNRTFISVPAVTSQGVCRSTELGVEHTCVSGKFEERFLFGNTFMENLVLYSYRTFEKFYSFPLNTVQSTYMMTIHLTFSEWY